ncbi:hypothetical protein SLA2020_418580 [Shorea laevis]
MNRNHYISLLHVSTTCGSQKIKFPFFIPGQQEPFCGYPGFELSCRNNTTPILTLRKNTDFTIQEIFYQNQSLHVSNSVVLDAGESTCIPRIKNTSIPCDRFKLDANQRELDDSVLALFGDDPVLGNVSEKCRKAVAAPVDVGGEGGVEDMLRRGFVMEWMASDCSICEAYGGICGFDNSTYYFKCFCPDRPHAWHCVPKGGSKGFETKVAAGTSAVGIGGLIILAFYRRKKFSTGNGIFPRLMMKDDCENIEAFLRDNMHLALKRYSFKDVTKMTNNFRDKLGEGDFGYVYKVGNAILDCKIGIARGLEYLHCRRNTCILHFDIKPCNILLDNDFCPKIFDFGLAKLCPVSMTGVWGTIGYIASSRSLWCIQTFPSNRPPMYRVVEMLQENLDSLEIPPESFLSFPPRLPADADTNFDSSSSLIL